MSTQRQSILKYFAIAVTATALLSCSAESITPPDVPANSLTIDLYLSRGHFGGKAFEHYKIRDSLLYAECGKEKVEKIEESTVVSLEPNQLQAVAGQVALLEVELIKGNSFPAAERGSAFFQPGLLELEYSFKEVRRHISTSVDDVSDAKRGSSLKILNQLASRIRGLAPVLCSSNKFFGLRRTNAK